MNMNYFDHDATTGDSGRLGHIFWKIWHMEGTGYFWWRACRGNNWKPAIMLWPFWKRP